MKGFELWYSICSLINMLNQLDNYRDDASPVIFPICTINKFSEKDNICARNLTFQHYRNVSALSKLSWTFCWAMLTEADHTTFNMLYHAFHTSVSLVRTEKYNQKEKENISLSMNVNKMVELWSKLHATKNDNTSFKVVFHWLSCQPTVARFVIGLEINLVIKQGYYFIHYKTSAYNSYILLLLLSSSSSSSSSRRNVICQSDVEV